MAENVVNTDNNIAVESETKEERQRKRRITFTPEPEDSTKKSRLSEPTFTNNSFRKTFGRKGFNSRRSEPAAVKTDVSLEMLLNGEYKQHVLSNETDFLFDKSVTAREISAGSGFDSKRSELPDVLMSDSDSATTSLSEESLTAAVGRSLEKPKKRIRSYVAKYWKVKPPFPRPPIVVAADGSCLTLFFTKTYVFSNHFPCDFVINGTPFSCSEQYYMYQKARHFGDREIADLILATSDPKEMKRLGRQVTDFDDNKWDVVALRVMKTACFFKFTQNKELRKELFRTLNTTLVEASPMDNVWGVGLAMDDPNIRDPKRWRGKNQLGYLLTKLRDHLKTLPQYESEFDEISRNFSL